MGITHRGPFHIYSLLANYGGPSQKYTFPCHLIWSSLDVVCSGGARTGGEGARAIGSLPSGVQHCRPPMSWGFRLNEGAVGGGDRLLLRIESRKEGVSSVAFSSLASSSSCDSSSDFPSGVPPSTWVLSRQGSRASSGSSFANHVSRGHVSTASWQPHPLS